jgi:glycosyltransferase involved in cell wall biosynthesis
MILAIGLIHILALLITASNMLYLRRSKIIRTVTEKPLVSVMIPARNEEENIKRLLPSLLAQGYPSFEIIVYDDASEDGTLAVLNACSDPRVRVLRGSGPPPGWIGKVHALYQATRVAQGELYLFLDADTLLEDSDALGRLVNRFLNLPASSVLSGLTRLRGGGLLLVSLVPTAFLNSIPLALAGKLPFRFMTVMNGQCWMIRSNVYHRFEPHQHLADKVLEDVEIGRYLKGNGVTPVPMDLQDEVAVFMYHGFASAWQGFRKNAYLITGGNPVAFILFFLFYVVAFVLAPLFSAWFVLSLYLLKLLSDRLARFPLWISILAPVSYVLASLLQFHSAWSHWTGKVSWKGRTVG